MSHTKAYTTESVTIYSNTNSIATTTIMIHRATTVTHTYTRTKREGGER